MTAPTTVRRAAYLRMVRDGDILQTFKATPDDDLVQFGAGLAVEAFEGRYDSARWQAREFYGIPEDAADLAAAAYLATVTPTMGAVIMQRPTEGSIREIRAWLRSHGIDTAVAPPPTTGT